MKRRGIDFTSALYLGLHHPSRQLGEWHSLTTGKPAFLYEPEEASEIGKRFGRLQGLATGLISKSSLHLFTDIFKLFDPQKTCIFYDSDIYSVALTGIQLAGMQTYRIIPFSHHCTKTLQVNIQRYCSQGQQALIVTDGYCMKCRKAPPLRHYHQIISQLNGFLIIDDTQSIGLLGTNASGNPPFGKKGGGILKWLNIRSERIITISSLAKAFGVPLAILGGSEKMIQQFQYKSSTRLHNSPPSRVDVLAAWHAYHLNQTVGDRLREKLLKNIRFFQKRTEDLPPSSWAVSPLQTLAFGKISGLLMQYLRDQHGIMTFTTQPHTPSKRTELGLIIRADHRIEELDYTIRALKYFLKNNGQVPAGSYQNLI